MRVGSYQPCSSSLAKKESSAKGLFVHGLAHASRNASESLLSDIEYNFRKGKKRRRRTRLKSFTTLTTLFLAQVCAANACRSFGLGIKQREGSYAEVCTHHVES